MTLEFTKDQQVIITAQQFILLFFLLFMFVGVVLSLSHSIFLLRLHAPNTHITVCPTKSFIFFSQCFLFWNLEALNNPKNVFLQCNPTLLLRSTRGAENNRCDSVKQDTCSKTGHDPLPLHVGNREFLSLSKALHV